ncbi:MAG: VOC family protein [Candidatus Dormibacteria bacterium]
MLSARPARTVLPALDIERARRFYGDTLGLTAVHETPAGIVYRLGDGSTDKPGWSDPTYVLVYATPNPTRGGHTQMGWMVDDIAAAVADLRAKGVTFEEYDIPGVETVDGVAKLLGGKALSAWFKDSEGNILGLVQFNE